MTAAAPMPAPASPAIWDEALLDGPTLALAEAAAGAAGLGLEAWLERAIRRACAADAPATLASPPVADPDRLEVLPRSRSVVIDQWPQPARRLLPRQVLIMLGPLLIVLAGVVFLAMLPAASPGPGAAAALPPAAASIPPAPPAAAEAAPQPEPEPSDPKALVAWLTPRAESGDALAQYRLGTAYALGKGVDKDYARAAPLLLRAAESGLAEAQYDYGVLCENGLGVPKDAKAATDWYGKAAAQGHPEAALSLGYAYAKGIGVARSMSDAAHWFRRAAELGVIDAQFNLAFLYDHGEGVAQSPTDAYAWYSIAAAHGDAAARDAVERIARTLPPQQLSDAKARAAELQKLVENAR
jgi:TPR repeat protein